MKKFKTLISVFDKMTKLLSTEEDKISVDGIELAFEESGINGDCYTNRYLRGKKFDIWIIQTNYGYCFKTMKEPIIDAELQLLITYNDTTRKTNCYVRYEKEQYPLKSIKASDNLKFILDTFDKLITHFNSKVH